MQEKRELRLEAALSRLTIGMIATPTGQLQTCRADELVSRVRKRASRFTEDYDHLPVEGGAGFFGFFGLKPESRGRVARADGFRPLTTAHLAGSERSILDELLSHDYRLGPRLVVSGAGVVGMLTPDDFQNRSLAWC